MVARVPLTELWKQVLALPPDEQRQLRERLNLLDLPPVEPTERERERRLAEKMQAEGILTPMPQVWPPVDRPERPLVTVQGQPVSETLIAERRMTNSTMPRPQRD